MQAGLPGDITVDVVVADWPGSTTPVITARWDDDDVTVTVTSNLPLDELLGMLATVRRATQDDWSAAEEVQATAPPVPIDDAGPTFTDVRVRESTMLGEGRLSDGRTWTAEVVPPSDVAIELDGGRGSRFFMFLAAGADAIRSEATAEMTATFAIVEPTSPTVRLVAWVGGVAVAEATLVDLGTIDPTTLDRREARCAGVRPNRALRRATDRRRGERGRSDRLDRSTAVTRGRSSGAGEIEFLAPRNCRVRHRGSRRVRRPRRRRPARARRRRCPPALAGGCGRPHDRGAGRPRCRRRRTVGRTRCPTGDDDHPGDRAVDERRHHPAEHHQPARRHPCGVGGAHRIRRRTVTGRPLAGRRLDERRDAASRQRVGRGVGDRRCDGLERRLVLPDVSEHPLGMGGYRATRIDLGGRIGLLSANEDGTSALIAPVSQSVGSRSLQLVSFGLTDDELIGLFSSIGIDDDRPAQVDDRPTFLDPSRLVGVAPGVASHRQ